MNSPVVKFKPEDEELSPFHRKLFRTGTRYIIPPLGELLRTEIREVGGIIARLGQDMVRASHDEPTLLHVIRGCNEAIVDAQGKNLEYRRITLERRRNWSETNRSGDY